MNSLVKQRIVGAIVLVALGVIFIPMFLTGEGNIVSDMDSSIPPKPAYEIQAPKVQPIKSQPPKEAVASAQSVEMNKDKSAQSQSTPQSAPENPARTATKSKVAVAPLPGQSAPQQSPKQQDSKQAAKTSKVTSPTKTTTKSTPTKPGVASTATNTVTNTATNAATKAAPKVEPKTVAKPKPVPVKPTEVTKPAPIVNGYVVQLGSFSVERNALKLRDKLRKAGHASFVEKFTKSGKTSYRVRVGPELTRKLAEQLQVKLKEQTKLNGFIIKYPQ